MGKKIDLEVNFFDVLGVKPSSTDEEVKKAYKALAKQWHPDKNRDEGAEDKFKVISAAYDTLKSSDLRSIYRRERENAQADAAREKRWKEREAKCFEKRYNDNSNSRFKTSFFFKTGGDPFGERSQKAYGSSSSDSWRYGGREGSPFSGPYQKKKSKPRKPWSQEWNEPSEDDDFKPFGFGFNSRPNFSSAFTSFVDDLFDFNSFFNGNDPFESFFKKYETIFKPYSEKKQPKTEFTYYTHFDDGSSSSKFQTQDKENRTQNGKHRKDAAPGFSFDNYSDDEEEKFRFECVCCGKKFSAHEDMVRHEIVCKDVNGKANGTTRMNKPPYVAKPTGDWRTTHENLVKNIRNLRRSSSRSRIEDEDEEEDIQMPPESNYIKCHICGRTFNKPAMERHTIYCQMRYQANCGEPDENMFFSRESYPKTMPNSYSSSSGIPPSGRSSQQSHPGSESPRMSRSTAPGKYSSKTCFPDLRTRRTMDEPFVFTSTGLHSHRSTSRNPSPSPRMYEFHFASKGSDNFGLSGKRMPFTEDRGHLTKNQCPNCCSVYAKNARYCISCGFKRSG